VSRAGAPLLITTLCHADTFVFCSTLCVCACVVFGVYLMSKDVYINILVYRLTVLDLYSRCLINLRTPLHYPVL